MALLRQMFAKGRFQHVSMISSDQKNRLQLPFIDTILCRKFPSQLRRRSIGAPGYDSLP
jgi:hypothetical protein